MCVCVCVCVCVCTVLPSNTCNTTIIKKLGILIQSSLFWLRHLPQQLMARQWVSTMVAATDTFNYEFQLLHNSMCHSTMLLIELFVFITFASLLINPIGKNLKFARDIFIYIHNIYIHTYIYICMYIYVYILGGLHYCPPLFSDVFIISGGRGGARRPA